MVWKKRRRRSRERKRRENGLRNSGCSRSRLVWLSPRPAHIVAEDGLGLAVKLDRLGRVESVEDAFLDFDKVVDGRNHLRIGVEVDCRPSFFGRFRVGGGRW